MTSIDRKELFRAKSLMKKGEYKHALELVESLKSRKRLSKEERMGCSVLEGRLRLQLGEYKRALALAEEILQTTHASENRLLAVDALIIRAMGYWRQGKLDEGTQAVKKGEKLLKEIEPEPAAGQETQINRRKGELLRHKGIIYWYRGDLEKALDCFHRSLRIYEKIDDKKGIADSLNNLGLVHFSKGNLNEALEQYQKALEIVEELGNKQDIAKILNNLGNIYEMKGSLDQGLRCHKRSLAIKEELGNKQEIALSLLNIGTAYQLKGDLNLALDHYQQSLKISETLDIKQDIALAKNNVGEIHELKGNLDQALEQYQQSLALYKGLGMKQRMALSLGNLGIIHRKKGDLKEASGYYQQSLAIYEETGNRPLAALIIFELVWTCLEREEPDLARQYLQKLQQINEATDNRIIDQRYRVAKALTLKSSKRARHKMKATEILEQVVDEEVGDQSLTVTAMIHLCDLLLSELKMTGEDELFGETQDLTSRLLIIASQQSSHSLLAETYLLQSKLALIELDMGQARKLLSKAHKIAEEKGLRKLASTVARERDALLSQLHKWEGIIKKKPSKPEMIDLTRLNDLLEQMITKAVVDIAQESRRIPREETPKKKYELVHLDLLKNSSTTERTKFRVAIAQIGVSKTGDILTELYEKKNQGLIGLRKEKIEDIRTKVRKMIETAHSKDVDLLLFPELTIDLNYNQISKDVARLAKTYGMHIIPGSYHDQEKRRNISPIMGPNGILWQQEKHIPAIIQYQGKKFKEGIEVETPPKKTVVCTTEFGRIAITICRDFLDMDLRVELKNSEPPVDLIFNPAFTPVTSDFRAAHFDARRSIYTYCFFANVAEFGDSFIYTPEKERLERTLPAREEGLIYKDVDLFRLRSERQKWEKKERKFIQSTRSGA